MLGSINMQPLFGKGARAPESPELFSERNVVLVDRKIERDSTRGVTAIVQLINFVWFMLLCISELSSASNPIKGLRT